MAKIKVLKSIKLARLNCLFNLGRSHIISKAFFISNFVEIVGRVQDGKTTYEMHRLASETCKCL